MLPGVEPEPFALGEHLVEASGKLVVLDQMLAYLRSKGHKVLLFSQMTRMLDILQDYLGYRGQWNLFIKQLLNELLNLAVNLLVFITQQYITK